MRKLFALLALIPALCFGATKAVVPAADGEGSLGTSTNAWGTGYFKTNIYVNGVAVLTNAGASSAGAALTNSVNRFVQTNSFDQNTYVKDLFLYGTNITSMFGSGGGASDASTNYFRNAVNLTNIQKWASVTNADTATDFIAWTNGSAVIREVYNGNAGSATNTITILTNHYPLATARSLDFTDGIMVTNHSGFPQQYDIFLAPYVMTNGGVYSAGNFTNFPSIFLTNGQSGASLGQLINSDGTNTSGNAYAEKDWVRGLVATRGTILYNITNLYENTNYYIAAGTTNTSGSQVRTYAAVTNNQYLGGGIISTQFFTQIQSPVTINAYLGLQTGAGRTLTIKPEIYYTYDGGTNLAGDWDCGGQAITTTQALYTFSIPFPTYNATNSRGFQIVRRFKVASQNNNPDAYVWGNGGATPSTVSFSSTYDSSLGTRGATNITMSSGFGGVYDTVNRVMALTNNSNLNLNGYGITNVYDLRVTNGISVAAGNADGAGNFSGGAGSVRLASATEAGFFSSGGNSVYLQNGNGLDITHSGRAINITSGDSVFQKAHTLYNATQTNEIVNWQTMVGKIESYGYLSQQSPITNNVNYAGYTATNILQIQFVTNKTVITAGAINGTNAIRFTQNNTNFWLLLP